MLPDTYILLLKLYGINRWITMISHYLNRYQVHHVLRLALLFLQQNRIGATV